MFLCCVEIVGVDVRVKKREKVSRRKRAFYTRETNKQERVESSIHESQQSIIMTCLPVSCKLSSVYATKVTNRLGKSRLRFTTFLCVMRTHHMALKRVEGTSRVDVAVMVGCSHRDFLSLRHID